MNPYLDSQFNMLLQALHALIQLQLQVIHLQVIHHQVMQCTAPHLASHQDLIIMNDQTDMQVIQHLKDSLNRHMHHGRNKRWSCTTAVALSKIRRDKTIGIIVERLN